MNYNYIGQNLREVRLNKKITLENVSKQINISIEYVNKIENDNFSELPGDPYTLGFIRAYANFLGLNTETIINQYKTQISFSENIDEVKLPKPIEAFPTSKKYKIISLMSIASISMIFYLSFINNNDLQPEYSSIPELPEIFETEIEEFEVEKAKINLKKINKSIILNNDNQLVDEIIILNDQISLNNDSKIKAVASKPNLIDVNNLEKVISIKALNPTWIQLRNEEDLIVYSRLMDKNEEHIYSISDNYFITVGNAGNIIVSIGGKLMGKLGKNGAVLDSLNISPDFFSN